MSVHAAPTPDIQHSEVNIATLQWQSSCSRKRNPCNQLTFATCGTELSRDSFHKTHRTSRARGKLSQPQLESRNLLLCSSAGFDLFPCAVLRLAPVLATYVWKLGGFIDFRESLTPHTTERQPPTSCFLLGVAFAANCFVASILRPIVVCVHSARTAGNYTWLIIPSPY